MPKARHYVQPKAHRDTGSFHVGILLLLGVVVIARNYLSIQPGLCVLFFVSALGVIFWFFGDYFIEKCGIWNHGK